jgi:hypothetical protein
VYEHFDFTGKGNQEKFWSRSLGDLGPNPDWFSLAKSGGFNFEIGSKKRPVFLMKDFHSL